MLQNPAMKTCSTPVKRSILGLVGFSLQAVGSSSALATVHINSFELQINSALEQSLASGLAHLSHLVELDMSHCGLTAPGCDLLSESLRKSTTLATLILDFNTVGDMGVASVCHHVLPLPSLRHVSIKTNGVGPEGGATVARALATRKSFLQLELQGNHVGCEVCGHKAV